MLSRLRLRGLWFRVQVLGLRRAVFRSFSMFMSLACSKVVVKYIYIL
jgi:hypothetical protein